MLKNSRGLAHLVPLIVIVLLSVVGGLYYVLFVRAAAGIATEAENFVVGPAPAAPGPMKLNPNADTWLDIAKPDSTHGYEKLLHAYGGNYPNNGVALLKFDLASVPNSIISAKLRMKVADSTDGDLLVRRAANYEGFQPNNSWHESTMTYNKSDRGNGEFLTSVGGGSTRYPVGSWVEVDVTILAQTEVGQELAVMISTTSTNRFSIFSKEELTAKPELVLTFGGSNTPLVYPVNDSAASGGKALKFYGNGSASSTVVARTDQVNAYLFISAKADLCGGYPPRVVVKIDGVPQRRGPWIVPSSQFTSIAMNVFSSKILSGPHKVEISFVNDLYQSGVCDKNVTVDKVWFSSDSVTDSTPPETTIYAAKSANLDLLARPGVSTDSRRVSFNYTSSKSKSTYECSLDNAAFSSCGIQGFNRYPLSVGSHKFVVRAIDELGNIDPTPATLSWTIVADTTPPNTLINSQTISQDGLTATFVYSTVNDAEVGTQIQCSIDDAAYVACGNTPTATSGSWNGTKTYNVSDGYHTFKVRSIDDSGNVDPTPASHTWRGVTDGISGGVGG